MKLKEQKRPSTHTVVKHGKGCGYTWFCTKCGKIVDNPNKRCKSK